MLIDKTTSPSVIVNTLIAIDSNGKPIKSILSFDTATRTAYKQGDVTEIASNFCFEAGSVEELNELCAALPLETEPTLQFHVAQRHAFKNKRGMVDADTSPDERLLVRSRLQPLMVQCTSCSQLFIVYIGNNAKIYTAKFAESTHTFATITEVENTDSITCDNCTTLVAITEPPL